ncbi:MAG: hypothetical protein WC958_00375 [Dehalococcoidales bacterium]
MGEVSKSLIITVLKKGLGDDAVDASMRAGAEGATVMYGRGVGVHEKKKIMGIALEPEKEIVFSVVDSEKVCCVMKEIIASTDLEKPGVGISFSVSIDKVCGIAHILPEADEVEAEIENEAKPLPETEIVRKDADNPPPPVSQQEENP